MEKNTAVRIWERTIFLFILAVWLLRYFEVLNGIRYYSAFAAGFYVWGIVGLIIKFKYSLKWSDSISLWSIGYVIVATIWVVIRLCD